MCNAVLQMGPKSEAKVVLCILCLIDEYEDDVNDRHLITSDEHEAKQIYRILQAGFKYINRIVQLYLGDKMSIHLCTCGRDVWEGSDIYHQGISQLIIKLSVNIKMLRDARRINQLIYWLQWLHWFFFRVKQHYNYWQMVQMYLKFAA